MNNRVINAESYIFSAIIYLGKDNFTSNDIAKILVERFSLQKSLLKAKAFAYNQIQALVKRGLLKKVKKRGIYQYLYSTTLEFNSEVANIKLVKAISDIPLQSVTNDKHHANNDITVILRSLIEKYTSELEKISGAKEVYDELIIALPNREKEFRQLSIEQEKTYIRINEKINTLVNIINESFAAEQEV